MTLITRRLFQSDMRIVVDFLAEGETYRSDRKIVHKAALIRMIKVLSGETDTEGVEEWLKEQGIREEDEISVCELFDQYERKGRREGIQEGIREGITQGIQVLILTCRDMKLSFAETAERVKKGFQLDDAELQRNMELYWPR